MDVLSQRALNRATLERQLLLRRSDLPVLDAVGHLVGLHAQLPLNPYLGLWSRLEVFEPEELSKLLLDRQVVRIVVMRGTIHLVTADDCLLLRPLMQPVLTRELERHSDFGPALRGVELEPVLAFARPLLAERPRTGRQLRAAFAERFPELDAGALAFACRNRLAAVQVPPRGVWGCSGQVTITTAESWLGRPLVKTPSIDEVMLRYLAAFGPANVADAASWTRLTGLRPVFDRLQPQLRSFRDEQGRELLDLPDAPLPHPDTPAPVRFLPEYDNVLLSHDDRTRVISEEHRAALFSAEGPVPGSVLLDGMVCGTWSIDQIGGATLVVRHVEPLTKQAMGEIAEEGLMLLELLEPEADPHDVRFVAVE